jgi:hypothetical protein
VGNVLGFLKAGDGAETGRNMKDGGDMDIDHWEEFDMGNLVAMASALAVRGRVFAWYCTLLASW